MNKKTMLAALAVSAALLALPAFASGQEIHVEGATTFTGSGGASSLVATGEPTFTCESTLVENGVINAGGTTGSLNLDIMGCHATLLGFTVKCHSKGSPSDSTVGTSGTFHFITFSSSPAVLITATPITLICAGISEVSISGNSIATITSPSCGSSSTQITLSFSSTGSSQNHRLYTGVEYDMKLQTMGGSQVTAATNQNWILSSSVVKLNCT